MEGHSRLFITLIIILAVFHTKNSNGAAVELNSKTELIYRQYGYDRNPFLSPNSSLRDYDGNEHALTSRSTANGNSNASYPYEEIRNYLKANQFLKGYFDSRPPASIGNRHGSIEDTDEGEELCRIRQYKVIYPKKLKNISNIPRTIINIEGEYEQAVEVRECASEGKCPRMRSLEFGYTSQCTQEYIIKKLMIYNTSATFDLFRLPACCVCKIKRTKG